MSCDLTLSYTFWAPGMEAPESLTKTITRESGPANRQEIDLYTSDKHGHAEWNAYDVSIQSTVGDPISVKIESPRLVDNGDDTYTYKGTINLPKLDDTCAMCLPKSRKRIELYNIDKYQPYFHAPLVDRVEGDAEEIILSADGRERSASYNEPGSITINATGGVWTRFDKVVKLEQQIHKIVELSENIRTHEYDVTTDGDGTSNPGTSNPGTGNPGTGSYNNSYSVNLDGSNGYIDCGGDADFSFTDGAGNDSAFSISAWVKLDDNLRARIASKGNMEWLFGTNSDNRFSLYLWSNDSTSAYIGQIEGSTLPTGVWHHLVATYDGSNSSSGIKLYRAGSAVGMSDGSLGTYAGMASQQGALRIGQWAVNDSAMNGLVDEVVVFDYELTPSQVSDIYNSGEPADISSLSPLGWWRMGDNNNGTGTVVTDVGSGGNAGTIVGNATFSTDVLQGDNTSSDEDTASTGDSSTSDDPYDPYGTGGTGALSPQYQYVFINFKGRPLTRNPALLAQVGDTLNFDRVTPDNHSLTESSFMRMEIVDVDDVVVAEQNDENPDWTMTWTPGTAGIYYYRSADVVTNAGGEILITGENESVIYTFNKKQFRSARGQVNVKIAGADNMYMTTDFRLIQSTDNLDTTNIAIDHGTFLTTDSSSPAATLGTYVSHDFIYITIQNVPQQAVVSGDVTLLS